eukprot:2496535-Pleurochrysis_carterae.AAC.1
MKPSTASSGHEWALVHVVPSKDTEVRQWRRRWGLTQQTLGGNHSVLGGGHGHPRHAGRGRDGVDPTEGALGVRRGPGLPEGHGGWPAA